jgi:UDP-N-acetylmuramyl tripeptide synthase
MVGKIPRGVILVTGTNGKTTTTHIITSLLEGQGLKVFTNSTGSNFTRGIISELLGRASIFGSPKADVAVLELDEAYGVHFTKLIKPRVSVFLNVMRDQLDRFGELDYTTSLLAKIAQNTTETVILNRDDNYIMKLENELPDALEVRYFGASEHLHSYFVNDDDLYAAETASANGAERQEFAQSLYASAQSNVIDTQKPPRHTTTLTEIDASFGVATYNINGFKTVINMKLKGVHNLLNAAAALSAATKAMGNDLQGNALIDAMRSTETAFGRGESIVYKDEEYELILVKNPSGFHLALASFEPDEKPVLILINDEYADGRDVSWLYDVDFSVLKDKLSTSGGKVPVMIGGKRGYDLTLKFAYTDNPVYATNSAIPGAFTTLTEIKAPKKRIYATYTAMLQIRALLKGRRGKAL